MGFDPRIVVYVVLGLFVFVSRGVNGFTEPKDFKILNDFRNGLKNPELLKWPDKGNDPCGPPAWPHVFCSNSGRVTQIQVQSLGLKGPLPQNFNQLDKLENLGFQRNKFNGKLPTFRGLSSLQFAYLDFNEFDTIPSDFFKGLSDVRVLALDSNPFNRSTGWSIPSDLAESSQLVNFSCSSCNIVGPVPDFLGQFPSLGSLRLSYNRLSGEIPSTFRDSMLQILWLNDQEGGGMTGSIDLIGSMVGLSTVWLHGNQFTGSIPNDIGQLTSLKELNLNRNRLIGLIPTSLADMNLQLLDLNNNMFMGPIPKFKSVNVTYSSNSFCQSVPGEQCAPEVTALLDFLRDLNYPERLASEWTGNDPCGSWLGVSCNTGKQVSVINLQRQGLNGTLSPSLANLSALVGIHLEGNNQHGKIPANLTQLRLLRLLNLSGNNFEPPLPRFRDGVNVVIDGNPQFLAPSPVGGLHLPPSPNKSPESPSDEPSSGNNQQPSTHDSPSSGNSTTSANEHQNQSKSTVLVIVAAAAGSTAFALLAILLAVYCRKKRKVAKNPPPSIVVHPKDSPGDMVKIAVVDTSAMESQTGSGALSSTTGRFDSTQIESGNLLISLQVLRKVTNNFARENELGRGGFGVVYKGELEDGTKLAVKRMVVGAISSKALDEFQSEIAVLSNVRHRNLVSLLGYSAEGCERLLVYEYMPKGALSRHLFRWKSLGLEPLSWTRRLHIALDVARGVEYLHSLAHHSFIHRDLKSANILLDDEFRAKVSDFGLVKLAPDRERSLATRLAGTFGYLAPEYAVTGKISTKVDVFSFGVILMELLMGLAALDEQRPEENRYLAEWFWQIKSNRETLIASIDPSLEAKEDIYETIFSIAALAGYCTARDPNHRPDIGHAVNVLAQLVEKWRPYEETDQYSGVDFNMPLPLMLKDWQEGADGLHHMWQEGAGQDFSGESQDSKGSIPAKPSGFADSFTSADAR